MDTYAVRTNLIKPDKIVLFESLVRTFNEFPNIGEPEDVSCHAVCRALAILYTTRGVTYQDGYFHKVGHDHSWLELGDGIVADMYPVAGINPFLIDSGHFMIPWSQLYIPEPNLLDTGLRDRAKHDAMAELLLQGIGVTVI